MTTATKTPIKATWNQSKVQEATAAMAASQCLAAFQTISKFGKEAIDEYKATARRFRVESLKKLGATNALELAKAIAEQDANLFGSQLEIAGDEKSATLTYNFCAMWDAMKKVGKLTPEQEQEMGAGFQTCMQDLANEFGLKSEVKFEGETCTVNFAK